jgi:hypothetical protein
MNEATWQQVAVWEKLHAQECSCGSTLLRFMGKPHDLRYAPDELCSCELLLNFA